MAIHRAGITELLKKYVGPVILQEICESPNNLIKRVKAGAFD